jgi:hypothetical protein
MLKKALFLGALVAMFTPAACGPSATSGRGQSCANSGDCKDGLLCVQQMCVQNDYPVAATAKECVVVECANDEDCCDAGSFPDACPDYQAACEADSTALECDYYDNFCVCDQICDTTSSQCKEKPFECATDDECGFGGTCDTTTKKCVECTTDDDCNGDEACVAGTCISGCTDAEDCGLFETCNATTKLCEYTGCKTGDGADERECILALGRSDAKCDAEAASGKPGCVVPCEENAECETNEVCTDGKCQFLGCSTDDECITYLKATGQIVPNPDDSVKARCVDLGSMK